MADDIVRRIARAGSFLAASLWLAGIPGPPAQAQRALLSRQCAFNHECAAGLVCAGGYCRAECATDRDCPEERTCQGGLYDTQDQLVRAVAAGESTVVPTGLRFAQRCRARVAQPPGAMRSQIPVIAPSTRVQGAAFQVTDAVLDADPRRVQAKCPTGVVFNGAITATASGAVSYRFTRSDGASGAVKVLKFAGPGAQPISETWSLGATTKGWMRVEILSPNAMTSPPASFVLDCVS